MDPLAGNQRAYRLADYVADSFSACVGTVGWIYRRVAARTDRSALPGCWGRTGCALFGSETADTNGICAARFTNGAETRRAPPARAGALHHRAGRGALDAGRIHKNESGQDFCCGGLGDERFDAPGALRSDSPDYEN